MILSWSQKFLDNIAAQQLSVLKEIADNPIQVAAAKFMPELTMRPPQAPYLYHKDDWNIWLFKGGRGTGKLNSILEPILTYNRGWIQFGKLKVGDFVYNEQGIPTEVLQIFEHPANPAKDYYELEF